MTTHEISGRYPSKILTYNGVVIESQGHFSGPRADAEWIRVAGFSSGVLNAWKDLEVDGHAQLKNRASAKHLTVHPDCILEAEQLLEFETAEIRGLVRARKMIVAQSCIITSTAEVHVDQLYFGSLQLEEGGILHGRGMSINLAKNLPVS
jgi:cytoskeletal protein CcmA (bactofilin family)